MPDLDFEVQGVAVREYAAVPSLAFTTAVRNRSAEPIRSIVLSAQVRILPSRRGYDADERLALAEVFGLPGSVRQPFNSFLWTESQVVVPAFEGETTVELPVTCTYDFEVVSAKYLHALKDGVVPLELLFSGTCFFDAGGRMQVERVPWDREARVDMPVELWRRTMDHYFPNSAWLRVRRDTFDRLHRFKAGALLPSWDEALDRLLDGAEEGVSA